jgi:hypothetical protein
VFILNVVKVLCFDTVLQVFILKVVKVAVLALLKRFARATNRDCHRDTEVPSWEIPLFRQESLDLLDYKGVGFFGGAKEFVTVSNGEG